jgi:Fe/S biogenesis protein NfuA
MIDVTLKEGIEKEMLAKFPEIKGVKDATDHNPGEHSYY